MIIFWWWTRRLLWTYFTRWNVIHCGSSEKIWRILYSPYKLSLSVFVKFYIRVEGKGKDQEREIKLIKTLLREDEKGKQKHWALIWRKDDLFINWDGIQWLLWTFRREEEMRDNQDFQHFNKFDKIWNDSCL